MRRRGFTLLEMLVASAIMGIAVTALLASLSASLHNAARLTEYDRAALLAAADPALREAVEKMVAAIRQRCRRTRPQPQCRLCRSEERTDDLFRKPETLGRRGRNCRALLHSWLSRHQSVLWPEPAVPCRRSP